MFLAHFWIYIDILNSDFFALVLRYSKMATLSIQLIFSKWLIHFEKSALWTELPEMKIVFSETMEKWYRRTTKSSLQLFWNSWVRPQSVPTAVAGQLPGHKVLQSSAKFWGRGPFFRTFFAKFCKVLQSSGGVLQSSGGVLRLGILGVFGLYGEFGYSMSILHGKTRVPASFSAAEVCCVVDGPHERTWWLSVPGLRGKSSAYSRGGN